MKALGLYLAACAAAVVVVGALAILATDAAGRQTILASALAALVVQAGAFGLARSMRDRNIIVGWGLGSLLRVVALVLYAVIVARLWRAQLTPALLSFAGFLFVTTLVEPVFLKR